MLLFLTITLLMSMDKIIERMDSKTAYIYIFMKETVNVHGVERVLSSCMFAVPNDNNVVEMVESISYLDLF